MDAEAALTVDVQLACGDRDIPGKKEIRAWVQLALEGSGRAPHRNAEIAVRVVDTDEIRSLNKQYRQKDSATNVLSFPQGTIDGLPEDERLALGDIVVCAGVVCDEAREQRKSVAEHWGHMLVHGTLHLLGYDHQTDAEAVEMERVETEILARRGIGDPYAS